MYITRHIENKIIAMQKMFKVLLVTGPRQVGKTTTLKHLFKDTYNYVTLDDINQLNLAKTDAKLFFKANQLPLIIDEVQYAPELFTEIKRIVDQTSMYGQIILTGAQAYHLMEGVSESLAGRVGIIEFSGLSLREINDETYSKSMIPDDEYLKINRKKITNNLWETIFKGDMPEVYSNSEIDVDLFYSSYVRTYIERDARAIINLKNLDTFSKFIIVLAARTAQVLNYSQIADEVGTDQKTIKSWIKILESSGIITIIKPFSNNALKRVISSPVLYFNDTGLVVHLLQWPTAKTLQNGAFSGQILETYAVSQIVKSYKNNGYLKLPLSFYRDHDFKEIDLIIEFGDILYPIEIKKTMVPNYSMIKNFDVLNKALGFKIGTKTILCLVDDKLPLGKDAIAYPISEI